MSAREHHGFAVTRAERHVADLLPIEVEVDVARAALDLVPFWFHTFALNREHGIYTPGAARDHRYRLPAVPGDFTGMRVLDVGTFDGFYAFLAAHRGAERVLAIDNEQYRMWVTARWGIQLRGGEGFQTISRLLGSPVEYRRIDAFALEDLAQQFDFIYCCGILHRVRDPLGLLRILCKLLVGGGKLLVETYGVSAASGDGHAVRPAAPGEIYARDEFVYWGFRDDGLKRLAQLAGFSDVESLTRAEVHGHPRIIGKFIA